MRTFDLSPLFRSTVGFDRFSRLLDSAARLEEGGPTYPPYNIEKLGEDKYQITMAVAGFTADDIEIASAESGLVIRGKVQQAAAADEQTGRVFLHRGIAARAFERHFQLADYIRVEGASLENGLLHVSLVREVPEALKPRTIKITSNSGAVALEGRQAA